VDSELFEEEVDKLKVVQLMDSLRQVLNSNPDRSHLQVSFPTVTAVHHGQSGPSDTHRAAIPS